MVGTWLGEWRLNVDHGGSRAKRTEQISDELARLNGTLPSDSAGSPVIVAMDGAIVKMAIELEDKMLRIPVQAVAFCGIEPTSPSTFAIVRRQATGMVSSFSSERLMHLA